MDQPTNPVSVSATVAIIAEIQSLRPLLGGAHDSLKRQRDMLQQRGMVMPPMTMQSFDAMMEALTHFEKILATEQSEVAQLRSLAENAAAISKSLVLEAVLRDAMDGVIQLSGAERGCIILVDAATGELDFKILRDNETIHNRDQVTRDQVTHVVPPEKAAQFSRSVIRQVMETGQPLLTSNANDDARLSGMQSVIALDLRSVMCAPLRIKDKTLGVVYVDNRLKFGVFGEREKTLVAAFANQVAAAISNARLFSDLQRTLSDITRVKDLTDNVFNSIDSGVVTTDDGSLILRANRAAAELLDVPAPDALTGKPLGTVVGPMKDALQDALKSVRDTGEVQVVEAEVSVGRRGRAILQAKVSPLKTAHGATQGAAMVMDDLTEQRERNETLRILKYYLPTAMLENITQIAGLGFGGERREVTCMFVDTLPLVHLPKGMRPQEIMQTINIYLSLASDCIHDAGGVIDKYMGTEVMALFNSQLNPLKNHAAAAVDAALRIREHFKVLYESMGQSNHLYHIGINTGLATLGNIGSHNRRDFTALGDSINVSKRLEENAQDGQIIITDETRQHLLANPVASRSKLRFEPLQPLHAKGRKQEITIYEVFST